MDILEARNSGELRKHIIEFSHRRSFARISATIVVDYALSHSAFRTIDNASEAFKETFCDNSLGQQYPVMQSIKVSSLPLLWNQNTYVNNGRGELWEHQAAYVYGSGIGLASHFLGDRHFAIELDSDRPLPKGTKQPTRVVADLQLFCDHVQEAVFQLFVDLASDSRKSLLMPR